MRERKADPIEHQSSHPLHERIERLKRLFPEAVNEDGLDVDALVNLLGKREARKERYNFTWAGKQAAILSLGRRSQAALKPAADESLNWDRAKHLFIEGDNLEVMKLLYKSYFGRVKMIYIDPPYNTGNDFVYPDHYAEPLANYLRLTGQMDDDGNIQTTKADKSGRWHSNWLSMMYPRLFLACQLLREDGVIFVSIDDNEVHNLRLLMNQIFGEENFVAIFPWRKRTGKSDVPFGVSQDYEWIICHAKSDKFFAGVAHKRNYHVSPDYPNDRWRTTGLTKQTTASDRENSAFDMVDPKTGKTYPFNPNRVWAVTKYTFQDYYDKGKIIFPGDYDFLNISKPVFRVFESEDKAKALRKYGTTDIMKVFSTHLQGVGNNADGTKEIIDLFGAKTFSFPKPVSLIQKLIASSTRGDDIILDFFAGSATTAQAVLEQNREDGGNRRFIMAQLPEPMSHAQFDHIADVGKERIRRVIKRMKSENASQFNGFGQPDEDLGFRVFRLDKSSMRQWQELPGDATPDEYVQQMKLFAADPLLDGWTADDVIAEVAVKEVGFSLTYRVERVQAVTEQKVCKVIDDEKEQYFYICLDDRIAFDALEPLRLMPDELFVFRDRAIDDTLVVNLAFAGRIKSI